MDNIKKYRGRVIKALNEQHCKGVIEFWKSLGFDEGHTGDVHEANDNKYIYYGLDYEEVYDNYSKEDLCKYGLEIIELPETKEREPEYPYEAIIESKEGRVTVWVHGKINNLYAASYSKENDLSDGDALQLHKEVEPNPQKITLTKKEIAEKFGLKADSIEIVD